MKEWIIRIDTRIIESIQYATHRPAWLDGIFVVVTRLGDYGGVWFLIALWLYFLWDQKLWGMLLCMGLLLVIFLGEWVIKNLIRRKRPFLQQENITPGISHPPKSFSFPSGHSAMSWAATVILIGIWGMNFVWTIPLAVLISLSRVYLRVHYPSDIFIGMFFGMLIGSLVLRYGESILSLLL